ncbi:hypothetical protein GDO86_003159 [Hymenochirus boettgeri]|uniref:Esterase OVCA2 n=1 Tax=Hymenochirus boettgeri TaxID=247094 RepID=A0A8T2JZU8_9PIPI|nr:hypothetical protein GDO86_003159 [Hymenochirus boettgeri]
MEITVFKSLVQSSEKADPVTSCGDPDLQDSPRGWWFSNPDKSFEAIEETNYCSGLEESLGTIAKAFSELGPFDGVLGFSQGAALVAILCSLKQQGDTRFQFDFALLFAGFKSRSNDHNQYYDQLISVPSLHVYGETDRVIPGNMSQELASHFENPITLTHSGGHYIPACAPQKRMYWNFLETFSTQKNVKY